METSNVKKCFEKIFGQKGFYSCIPCDELDDMKLKSFPFILCINNKPAGHIGEHWLGMYLEAPNAPLEFFCSYGRPLESYGYHFVNFVRRNRLRVRQKYDMLQSPFSTLCGWYVVYYMYKRKNNFSPDVIYAKFSKNRFNNDLIIRNFKKSFIRKKQIKF